MSVKKAIKEWNEAMRARDEARVGADKVVAMRRCDEAKKAYFAAKAKK